MCVYGVKDVRLWGKDVCLWGRVWRALITLLLPMRKLKVSTFKMCVYGE